MKFSITTLFLLLITLFFLFTRLYKIAETPISVYWDEASIGYNAYAIAKDGKDEWGEFLPLHFRAFGEFKLPVYIYAVVPFVKLFGLNEFSVRGPAVLFSLGVVILIYFLAKKIWQSETIGLLSSFFISVSPWFFIFSRTGYEATAGLMFYLLGIYLFLQIKEKNSLLLFSVLSFILSMYSYNSFRIITPLTLIILTAASYGRLVYHNRGKILLIVSLVFLLVSLIPIYRLYIYDMGIGRLQSVGATKVAFVNNYLSHFSPDFLILEGDKNLRSQQAGFGQLYFPDLILLPLGFLFLIRSKSKDKFLPLVLLLLGPISAAITKESPHALRSISAVPFISIVSAVGVVTFGKWTNRGRVTNLIIVIVFLIFFINYFFNFLNIYPLISAKEWQYEYKKIYTNYSSEFDKYSKIMISEKYAQPYIFALFYLKYDPNKFREEVVRNEVSQWGFSTVKKFGKFEFGKFPNLLTFEK